MTGFDTFCYLIWPRLVLCIRSVYWHAMLGNNLSAKINTEPAVIISLSTANIITTQATDLSNSKPKYIYAWFIIATNDLPHSKLYWDRWSYTLIMHLCRCLVYNWTFWSQKQQRCLPWFFGGAHQIHKCFNFWWSDMLLQQFAVIMKQRSHRVLSENVIANLLLHERELLCNPLLSTYINVDIFSSVNTEFYVITMFQPISDSLTDSFTDSLTCS